MLKTAITIIIIITIICVQGCRSLKLDRQANSGKLSQTVFHPHEGLRRCAADSLYALCTESNIPVSQQLCMELLPPSHQGNSMLEFKKALLSLGFEVEARRLSVDELTTIHVPSVLLILPLQTLQDTWGPPLGHYIVLWPLDEENVRILDHPRDPFVLSMGYLAHLLRDAGITNIPVLFCGK